jgi:hypothetical protein
MSKKTGRPRVEINWDEFDKLCAFQCTLIELAAWFECSVDTIERSVVREKKMPFAAYFDQKRGKGKIALRRVLFQNALNGNVPIGIWLSKQYLGMTEKTEIKDSSPDKTITLKYEPKKPLIKNEE